MSKYKVRFQRQKAIGDFITDFYCHKAKLVVEIDGTQHSTPQGKANDEFRTEILNKYCLKVIRFTNLQINANFNGVCDYIDLVVRASLPEECSRKAPNNLEYFRICHCITGVNTVKDVLGVL